MEQVARGVAPPFGGSADVIAALGKGFLHDQAQLEILFARVRCQAEN